jgi:hypothetical protein
MTSGRWEYKRIPRDGCVTKRTLRDVGVTGPFVPVQLGRVHRSSLEALCELRDVPMCSRIIQGLLSCCLPMSW